MGMICEIFRPSYGDCSNGGISRKFNKVCVVNVEGPFEPHADAPAVVLMVRNLFGTKYVHAEPVLPEAELSMPMFGGTLIYSSDSRFNEAVAELSGYRHGYAVKLHDRFER